MARSPKKIEIPGATDNSAITAESTPQAKPDVVTTSSVTTAPEAASATPAPENSNPVIATSRRNQRDRRERKKPTGHWELTIIGWQWVEDL